MIKSAKPLSVESQADLHDIIRYGDINQLRAALKKKYNPLDKDVNGYTALHIAALYGKLELMKHLIEEEQLYPTVPGPKKATPLTVAAGNGNLSIVKYLIEEQHIDPSADRDEDGYLAIHRACQNSKLSVVKYLLEKSMEVCLMEAKDVLSDFTQHDTALHHIAALNGNIDTVKYFTEECKCDTNLLNKAGRTALFHACQNGNLEVVKYLVEVGHCQCSITDSSLNTPLHLAAQHDNLSVVQYLLEERKCDASPKNGKHNTPLLEASYAGQVNIVKYLLENGYSCNPKAYGSNGYNCLHAACRKGHVEVVQYLTEDRHMDPSASIRKANLYSKTKALHIASQYGHGSIVDYLTTKWNMNASLPDEHGKTALHLAVIHDHFEVVRYLVLSNHCDASIIPRSLLLKNSRICDFMINEDKETKAISLSKALVHSAIISGNLSTLQKLSHKSLKSYSDKHELRPIHLAAMYGHLDLVKYFIEERICKPDLLKCDDHITPLHLAASYGHVHIVKYLVEECKCDLMCKTSTDSITDFYLNGATPLHLAVRFGHLFTVKYILESDYGIDAEIETSNGTTPLLLAAMGRNVHVVKYLIEKHNCNPFHRNNDVNTLISSDKAIRQIKQELKRNPDVYDYQGKSTIHISARVGSLSVVEYLVSESGVDPNMRSFNDETPLHYAAFVNHLPIVKYLTQLPNCDIACRDSDLHFTPLHMAACKGNYEVVKYLTQLQVRNAGHRRQDINGNTPLHLAAQYGHFEVVKFFCKEMGTSPAIKNHYKETPLHLALKYGCAEVALYLIALLYSEYQDSGF